MNPMKAILPLLALTLAGCAGKIETPLNAPTASVTASVVGFAEKQDIISGVENAYFEFSSADGSWGGEELIKADAPSKTYNVPANKNIKLRFASMQGGFAYDGTCGVSIDTKLPQGQYFMMDFALERVPNSKKIGGCHVDVYRLDNGKKVKLERYDGSANIRHWVLNVGGLTMAPHR